MVVALMTQATAYIGARALPEVLLNNDYSHSLLELAVGHARADTLPHCGKEKALFIKRTITVLNRTL